MRRHLAWACGLGLAAVGCGDSSGPVTKADIVKTSLNDVGAVYRASVLQNHRPPAKLADLEAFERMSPTGVVAVKSGDVVVRYGANLPDTDFEPGKSPSDEVLAYEKQVPQDGGKVLMLNRTVRTMTADEFKAAKLAGDGSSAPAPAAGPGGGVGKIK